MVERTTPITDGERAWLDRLVMPLPRGATILDLGCGAGEPIDRYLIDRGFQIVGIDHRAPLIDLARTRFPRQRWILGDMRTVMLDEDFAAILAWESLHLLSRTDQAAMAERVAGWLKPGGRLLFSVLPVEQDDLDGFRPGSRFRDDLSAADYSSALTRRGLIELVHVENDRSCKGAAVWLIRKP
ncbi:MAG: class I SAM-dependent methyltransferase [Sphingomonas sp.]|jgi:trans-aconitate methyltransferase|uniref:class I SAM-dependent methyltransferase n=1 Tax=Sphingomonas sp. TaxID=28214 RepID=UPI003569D6B4